MTADATGAADPSSALVVRGHSHHRAGAVLDQDEVGDPDRHRLSGERVDRRASRIESLFLDLAGHASCAVLRLESLQVAAELASALVLAPLLDEPMLRREQDEVGAVDGVDARGEDFNSV